MGRLHVKFHEDRCKGEAVMRLKPFYLTAQSLHCDLDLWPFDPKVHRAHTWLMGRLHVKFHEDRCKGEAFMRLKPFYLTARLQTDGRTDRRTDGRTGWFQYTPPNFVAGGIIKQYSTYCRMRWDSRCWCKIQLNYRKPSFVRGALISRFIYQVPIHSVLYSRETNFCTWLMCKLHATDIFAMF